MPGAIAPGRCGPVLRVPSDQTGIRPGRGLSMRPFRSGRLRCPCDPGGGPSVHSTALAGFLQEHRMGRNPKPVGSRTREAEHARERGFLPRQPPFPACGRSHCPPAPIRASCRSPTWGASVAGDGRDRRHDRRRPRRGAFRGRHPPGSEAGRHRPDSGPAARTRTLRDQRRRPAQTRRPRLAIVPMLVTSWPEEG